MVWRAVEIIIHSACDESLELTASKIKMATTLITLRIYPDTVVPNNGMVEEVERRIHLVKPCFNQHVRSWWAEWPHSFLMNVSNCMGAGSTEGMLENHSCCLWDQMLTGALAAHNARHKRLHLKKKLLKKRKGVSPLSFNRQSCSLVVIVSCDLAVRKLSRHCLHYNSGYSSKVSH